MPFQFSGREIQLPPLPPPGALAHLLSASVHLPTAPSEAAHRPLVVAENPDPASDDPDRVPTVPVAGKGGPHLPAGPDPDPASTVPRGPGPRGAAGADCGRLACEPEGPRGVPGAPQLLH